MKSKLKQPQTENAIYADHDPRLNKDQPKLKLKEPISTRVGEKEVINGHSTWAIADEILFFFKFIAMKENMTKATLIAIQIITELFTIYDLQQ